MADHLCKNCLYWGAKIEWAAAKVLKNCDRSGDIVGPNENWFPDDFAKTEVFLTGPEFGCIHWESVNG